MSWEDSATICESLGTDMFFLDNCAGKNPISGTKMVLVDPYILSRIKEIS